MGSSRSTNTSRTNHILSYFQLYASYFFLLPNCVIWIHLSSGKKTVWQRWFPSHFYLCWESVYSFTHFCRIIFLNSWQFYFWLCRLVVGSFPTELWFPTRPRCQTQTLAVPAPSPHQRTSRESPSPPAKHDVWCVCVCELHTPVHTGFLSLWALIKNRYQILINSFPIYGNNKTSH